jgi:hypothetical protein
MTPMRIGPDGLLVQLAHRPASIAAATRNPSARRLLTIIPTPSLPQHFGAPAKHRSTFEVSRAISPTPREATSSWTLLVNHAVFYEVVGVELDDGPELPADVELDV